MEQVKKRPNTREDYLEEIARLKKEKNAAIEDKTFGLKNKNKSAKVQK